MKNRVITISREFGSGGRTIGKKVAEELGIACYDSELICKIARESGFDEQYIHDTEETSSGGIRAWLSSRAFCPTNEDILWIAQCKVITELAQKGPCVIVGRCADYVLRDKADCLKVFIHADTEFRLRRIVEVYGEWEASPEQRLKDKDLKNCRAANFAARQFDKIDCFSRRFYRAFDNIGALAMQRGAPFATERGASVISYIF